MRTVQSTIAAVIVTLSFSTIVAAAGTDVIELPASNGKVTFSHQKHQQMLNDCTKCHSQQPGKIADLGKNWAHTTCKGCHSEMSKGPTSCKDCHIK